MAAQDTVTTVVSMLERKNLGCHAPNRDTSLGNSFTFYDTELFQQTILRRTGSFPTVRTTKFRLAHETRQYTFDLNLI